jgi:hypothetical protein
MAKRAVKFDPDDGLIVGEVGPWAVEKHDRVKRYIQAARGVRARFLAPKGNGGATYIELYSGAGRSLIKDTNQIIDGSAVADGPAARKGAALFLRLSHGARWGPRAWASRPLRGPSRIDMSLSVDGTRDMPRTIGLL